MGRGNRGHGEGAKMRGGGTREALADRQKSIEDAYSDLRKSQEGYREESAPLRERLTELNRPSGPRCTLAREVNDMKRTGKNQNLQEKERELDRYDKEVDDIKATLSKLEEPIKDCRSRLNEELKETQQESRDSGKKAFEDLADKWQAHLRTIADYEKTRAGLEELVSNRSFTEERRLEFQREIERLDKAIAEGHGAPSAKDIESMSEEDVEALTPSAAREEAIRQEAESMDEKEFMELLSRVDWYYYFSDDPAAEARGKRSYSRAKALAATDPQKQKMFDDYKKYARQKTSGEKISRPEPSNYV